MDLILKWMTLIMGLLMTIGGLHALFFRSGSAAEKKEESTEIGVFVYVLVLSMGVILLRLSWVMFFGPDRSLVL